MAIKTTEGKNMSCPINSSIMIKKYLRLENDI